MASSVWPILHYDDPGAALRFLVDVVGFGAEVVVRDDAGEVIHAEVSWPGGGTVLLGGTAHDDGVHAGLRAGALYVVAPERMIDAVHARVVSAGGTVVVAPHRTSFAAGGPAHACTVADPEGNLWTFGSYPGGG